MSHAAGLWGTTATGLAPSGQSGNLRRDRHIARQHQKGEPEAKREPEHAGMIPYRLARRTPAINHGGIEWQFAPLR